MFWATNKENELVGFCLKGMLYDFLEQYQEFSPVSFSQIKSWPHMRVAKHNPYCLISPQRHVVGKVEFITSGKSSFARGLYLTRDKKSLQA